MVPMRNFFLNIIELTLASEKMFFSKVSPDSAFISTGVPESSSLLKQEVLNSGSDSKPGGQSLGATEQKKGFPNAHNELFHLNLKL